MSMESDVNTMVVLVPKRHNPNRASNVSFFTDYESRSSSSIKRDKRRIETVPQITLHNLSCVRHYTSSPKFVPDGLCVSSIKKANVFHQCVPKKKKKKYVSRTRPIPRLFLAISVFQRFFLRFFTYGDVAVLSKYRYEVKAVKTISRERSSNKYQKSPKNTQSTVTV